LDEEERRRRLEEARVAQEDKDAIRKAEEARRLFEDNAIAELNHFKQ
jgi:hypothetical protein